MEIKVVKRSWGLILASGSLNTEKWAEICWQDKDEKNFAREGLWKTLVNEAEIVSLYAQKMTQT